MNNVSLNPLLVQKCLYMVEYSIDRRRRSWLSKKLQNVCMFLFFEPGIIRYVASNGYRLIEITEPVNFSFDYDYLAIDTSRFHYLGENEMKDRMPLEIPECTMSNLAAFNNPNRPNWIKEEDLKTSAIRLGSRKLNIAYIKKANYQDIFKHPKTDLDFLSFDWNKRDETEMPNPSLFHSEEKLKKFDSDFDAAAKVIARYRYAEYSPEKYPPESVLMLRKTIYADDSDDDDKGTTHEMPLAFWQEKVSSEKHPKQISDYSFKLVVAGKSKEINGR